MKILDGKIINKEIIESLKKRIEKIKNSFNKTPYLAIINYYDNTPSSFYMNLKVKLCSKLGIETKIIKPEINKGKSELLRILKEIERDDNIDALMIERPLPSGFDDMEFWDNIPYKKDVDCLSSINNGRLYINKNIKEILERKFFSPCTALAVIKILEKYEIDVSHKKSAVIGRSPVVGKPLAHMLSCTDSTVTLCHSKTKDIETHIKEADLVFLAIGKAKWLKKDMIGDNQIIIDIGTNLDEKGSICGDADFEDVKEKAAYITPVPGGVGPVTLALLIENTVIACQNKLEGL